MKHRSSFILISAGILWVVGIGMVKAGQMFGRKQSSVYDLLHRQRAANAGSTTTDNAKGQARVVHFPEDKSLGQLHTQDADVTRELNCWFHWTANGEPRPEYLCEAQGDVAVPVGKRLILWAPSTGVNDLSALETLRPDDLYGIRFLPAPMGQGMPACRSMQHIAHLTGLRKLELGSVLVSDSEMRHIKNLTSLEYLTLPVRGTDKGVAYLAGLPCLKGLYETSAKNRITDEGLGHIGRIASLEELYLMGEYMTDAGLAHLKNLPGLKYLCLRGRKFTDAGCVHIKQISSLRILSFHEKDCRISDAGLAQISQMPDLDTLCLHGMKNITDNGIAHLAKMRSLRKLDIGSSQVTDRGLEYISEIRTLESLGLPQDQKGITDKGLEYLSRLPNLKRLGIVRVHWADPKMNRDYYTDKGLEFLSRCHTLENLGIGSVGITDVGMEHVAKLTNLKSLNVFGCDNITDRGLAELVTLRSLETLQVYSDGVTIAGVNRLNSLSNVKRLKVSQLQRGGAVLNLSGMLSLEDVQLTFHRRADETFTDADLACFKDLKELTGLQLGGRNFSDSGMRHLAGLTKMKSLSIGGPELTDAGIRHLAAMEQLGMLNVLSSSGDSKLTDETLRFLERFKMLGVVRITSDILFSQAAVRHLEKELPNLYLAQIQPTSSAPQSNRLRGSGTSSSRRR